MLDLCPGQSLCLLSYGLQWFWVNCHSDCLWLTDCPLPLEVKVKSQDNLVWGGINPTSVFTLRKQGVLLNPCSDLLVSAISTQIIKLYWTISLSKLLIGTVKLCKNNWLLIGAEPWNKYLNSQTTSYFWGGGRGRESVSFWFLIQLLWNAIIPM